MKKISLFGYKLTLDIKKSKQEKKERYVSAYTAKEKIIFLIFIMFIITISSKLNLINNENNYKVGDIVRSDIYAPRTVVFKDYDTKEKIIESMVAESGREYIFSSDVERLYLEKLDLFFNEILDVKEGKLNSINYKYIEKNTGRKISRRIVEGILELSEEEIKNIKEETTEILSAFYKAGVFQEKNVLRLDDNVRKEFNKLDSTSREIVNTFLSPNYIYDVNKTRSSIQEKVSQIEDQYVEIKSGTLVVKTGEVLTDRKFKILEKLGIYSYRTSIVVLLLNITYLLIVSMISFTIIYTVFKGNIKNKNIYNSTFLIVLSILILFRFINNDFIYIVPFEVVLFLLVFLTSPNFAISIFSFTLMFVLPIVDYDLTFLAIHMIYLVFTALIVKKVNTRSGIIAVGIQLSILKMILFLLLSYFAVEQNYGVAVKATEILVSGFLSGMITIALLPYFERTFNILTVFKLIELGDMSHPLLKNLSMQAPGTFNHSLVVAVLSENAATSIGANPIFARVASYYHDIGKVRRPNFFVENQSGGINPHDNISPFLSRLILTSHTKDGVTMAKEYQIPKEIREVMLEHHGTTLLTYFYNKAKAIDPNINTEEFRYGGPTPKTKESAIIMLADSIEAAVRSIEVKTPVAIEQMIRRIINSKIEDNQLVDADLTFREIEIIINSFIKTLTGIHHARLKYPGQK